MDRAVGPGRYLEQGLHSGTLAHAGRDRPEDEGDVRGEAVALLAKFLFRYDQMRTPVGRCPAARRTRLELCLLMLSGANC